MSNNLRQFAAAMTKIAQQVDRGSLQLMKTVTERVVTEVAVATPIDTGQAQLNWKTTIGRPDGTFTQIPRTAHVDGAAASIIVARLAVDRIRQGDTVYVSNNAPYIGVLNQGYSPQAPSGYVLNAIAKAVQSIRGVRIIP